MRRTMAVVVAILTTVALMGCSSSKKSSSTVAAGSNSSATTSGSSATTAGSSSSGGSGGGSTKNIKWCDNTATNNLIQQMQANAATATNTDTMQKDLDILKGYESDAPSAIKGDVTTLVNFYAKFVGIYTADKSNPQKLITDMQGIQADQASLQAASQHIQAWAAANCHS